MFGHPVPRRQPARQMLLPLTVLLLVAIALFAVLIVAGCGSTGATTTTTAAQQTTTSVAASTTSASGVSTATTAAATTSSAADTSTSVAVEQGAFPVTVTDDNNDSVTIKKEPQRIVSSAPANTEMLFAIGAGDRVVGVTTLDDYPPEVAKIAKVGDFKLNTEAVIGLNPDLVVGYSGNEEALAPVKSGGVPVVIFNPTSLAQIYTDIETLGKATGTTDNAGEVVSFLKQQVQAISETAAKTGESPKVFYALDNTLYTAGPGSFVDELLKLAHATNVADTGAGGAAGKAYYQFAPEQLVAADPDVILLPGSMYKSAAEFAKDPRFASLAAVKKGRVVVIDDVIVTRPGTRIAEGLKILAAAIHPGAF
jgi:iron complex transport system substrate-binding protein